MSADNLLLDGDNRLVPPTGLSDSISCVPSLPLEEFTHFVFWGAQINANNKHIFSPNSAMTAFPMQNLYDYSNRQKAIKKCKG